MKNLYITLEETFKQLIEKAEEQKPMLLDKLAEVAPEGAYNFEIFFPFSLSDKRIHGYFKTPSKWGPKTHAYNWSYTNECWEIWD